MSPRRNNWGYRDLWRSVVHRGIVSFITMLMCLCVPSAAFAQDGGGPLQLGRSEFYRVTSSNTVDRTADPDPILFQMVRDLDGELASVAKDLIAKQTFGQQVYFHNNLYFGSISISHFQQDGLFVFYFSAEYHLISQDAYHISLDRYLCATETTGRELSPCGDRLVSRPLRDREGMSGPRVIRDEYRTAVDQALFRISIYWLDMRYDRDSVRDIQIADRGPDGNVASLRASANFNDGARRELLSVRWANKAVSCITLVTGSGECYPVPVQTTREALLEGRKEWELPALAARAAREKLEQCATRLGPVYGPPKYFEEQRVAPDGKILDSRRVQVDSDLIGARYQNTCAFTIIVRSRPLFQADTSQEVSAGAIFDGPIHIDSVDKK